MSYTIYNDLNLVKKHLEDTGDEKVQDAMKRVQEHINAQVTKLERVEPFVKAAHKLMRDFVVDELRDLTYP